jgi:hypothetical protein
MQEPLQVIIFPGQGGLQPKFLGSPSIPPSFAETEPKDPGESFPAGIPHPSLSPPDNPSEKKTGGGQEFLLTGNGHDL